MARLVIESGRTETEYWSDLWRFRELFYVLAWRDVSVKYRQTAIGVLWAFLQPFIGMVVFTFIFGRMAKLPSGGVPYPLLVFAGMLPWNFVSNALTGASQSLIGNSNLISKVYFPRLIVPTSTVVTSFVDLLVAFTLMAGTYIWFQYLPPWQVITLPFFIIMAFFTALGPGLLITALNVKYRDFRYIVPFMVQIGIYISPVGYLSSNVGDKWGNLGRLVYSLNPVVGVIDGFRWALLGGDHKIYWPGMAVSASMTLLLLWLGVNYFRRMEKTFADII